MDRSAETRTLRDYLRVIRQRRGLIILITVLAAAAAVAYSLVKDPVYDADATLSFKDPSEQAGSVLGQQSVDFFPEGESAQGAKILTRSDVLDRASASLGLTRDELSGDLDVSIDSTSNLVTVTGSNGGKVLAARIANEVARQAQTVAREEARSFYEDRADQLKRDPVNRPVIARLRTLAAVAQPVRIVSPASVPESPATPQPVRDTIIAVILGLLIGIGAAFLRHALDRRIRDPHEVQKSLGIPLVGHVRSDALGMSRFSANGSSSFTENDLEPFRILRTNVDFLAKGQDLKTIAVTSALAEEGKSSVSASYAYASAVAGRRTLLVECDFRRPVFAERFGFDSSPGLSDYLAGEAKPADVLRVVPVEGPVAESLPVIPAGDNRFQPAEMIASERFREFLRQVSKAYELVVIDCAPLLPVGDTLELLPQVDGMLLCVRLEQTTRDQAIAAKEALDHLPGRPTGLVITGLRRGGADDYYGYYYSAPAKTKAKAVS